VARPRGAGHLGHLVGLVGLVDTVSGSSAGGSSGRSGRSFGGGRGGGGTTPVRGCPCGSGTAYALCCGPALAGERDAATAEELMRSRYTAFATGDVDHLVRTWHPRTRPEVLELDPSTTWTGLTVVRTERGAAADDEGVVEFVAGFEEPSAANGRAATGRLHELSRFARRAGRWVYLDGDQR
jgi:SEC-C motif-containing protein